MSKYFLFIAVFLLGFVLYHTFQVQRKIQLSKQLVKQAKPFSLQSDDTTRTLLVLGDSTAIGVGASMPEDSVPALFAGHIGATLTENRGVSGAKISDVQGQIDGIVRKEYRHILLQVGSNNIVALQSVEEAEKELRTVLQMLPKHENLTVIVSGNVGAAKLIPWFLRDLYTKKSLEYHALFEKVVPEFGGTYVNLYTPKSIDPFVLKPEVYLAKDEFHPSSQGYRLWFEKIQEVIKKEPQPSVEGGTS